MESSLVKLHMGRRNLGKKHLGKSLTLEWCGPKRSNRFANGLSLYTGIQQLAMLPFELF
jgi:hypothetical protein